MIPTVTSKIYTRASHQIVFRSFSSNPPSNESFFSRIKKTLTGSGGSSSPSSSPQTQNDEYAKQITEMANAELWTLSNFHQQIKSASGGWKAKLPGMGNTDAVKAMKSMQQLLEATMEVAGNSASAKELKELGRKEKLQISIKSGAELKDINALIQQFQSMDVMHRVLRYRVKNGLEIPKDEEGAKMLMQKDVKKVLSSQEVKEMQKVRMKLLKRH
mmetsp:Transcript_13002/g.24427  ORF Transcript_13002/g.24427 Transcript_13002/m.24427 type:complete len:216 (-) Transcript_13002:49-696(-)